MNITEEFAQLLHDLGLGTYTPGTAGGTLYLTKLPQTPDTAAAITRYGGSEPDSLLGYDEPRIQIRCRGPRTDGRIAENTAQAIYDALIGLSNRTLPGGTWLVLINANQSGPAYLGTDGDGRDEWVVNLRAEIENISANRR